MLILTTNNLSIIYIYILNLINFVKTKSNLCYKLQEPINKYLLCGWIENYLKLTYINTI